MYHPLLGCVPNQAALRAIGVTSVASLPGSLGFNVGTLAELTRVNQALANTIQSTPYGVSPTVWQARENWVPVGLEFVQFDPNRRQWFIPGASHTGFPDSTDVTHTLSPKQKAYVALLNGITPELLPFYVPELPPLTAPSPLAPIAGGPSLNCPGQFKVWDRANSSDTVGTNPRCVPYSGKVCPDGWIERRQPWGRECMPAADFVRTSTGLGIPIHTVNYREGEGFYVDVNGFVPVNGLSQDEMVYVLRNNGIPDSALRQHPLTKTFFMEADAGRPVIAPLVPPAQNAPGQQSAGQAGAVAGTALAVFLLLNLL
ncbi:MAG: hypothetical protein AB1705_26225 [Verrucomicrobiota bacterium]